MGDWPEPFVEQIAQGRWVLFVGAGVAQSCENAVHQRPPSWGTLLSSLASDVHSEDNRDVANALIARQSYLDAADHIRWSYEQESRLNAYLAALKREIAGPESDPFRKSDVYDKLLDLSPRTVFTTNYDKLFEAASLNAYNTHLYDSKTLSDHVRRNDAVLVKIHGTIDQPEHIILSQRDYARLQLEGSATLEVLRALALTQTIFFVGYGLGDPDIQLALRSIGPRSLAPEAHFILAEEPETQSRADVFRECYNVSLVTYPRGSHEVVVSQLSELALKVEAARSGGIGA